MRPYTKSRRLVYRLRSGKAGLKCKQAGLKLYSNPRPLRFSPTERPDDRAIDRATERQTERPSDRATGRSTDRPSDPATGRSNDPGAWRPSDRPSHRPSDPLMDWWDIAKRMKYILDFTTFRCRGSGHRIQGESISLGRGEGEEGRAGEGESPRSWQSSDCSGVLSGLTMPASRFSFACPAQLPQSCNMNA